MKGWHKEMKEDKLKGVPGNVWCQTPENEVTKHSEVFSFTEHQQCKLERESLIQCHDLKWNKSSIPGTGEEKGILRKRKAQGKLTQLWRLRQTVAQTLSVLLPTQNKSLWCLPGRTNLLEEQRREKLLCICNKSPQRQVKIHFICWHWQHAPINQRKQNIAFISIGDVQGNKDLISWAATKIICAIRKGRF